MRRRAAWLVTVPIALFGVEAAHVLANGLFGSREGPGELFAHGRSGAGLILVVAAVGLALPLLGMGTRIAGFWGSSARGRAAALPFACLPPVAFTALELTEGICHHGAVPWDELVEPTFVVGLLLQLPFAAAGYVIARVLLRVSDAVRRLIVRRPAAPRVGARAVVARRPRSQRPRRMPRRSALSGRGPPAGLLASG